MKKKSVKILAFALVASMLLTTNSTLADDRQNSQGETLVAATTTEQTETEKLSAPNTILRLSLEDAFKMIEAGNNTLKLTDSKIAIYEKQYEQAKARYDANYAEVDENSAKERRLNPKKTLWTLEDAKHDREKQIKDLKVQIANQYQNILALEQQAKSYEAQIKNVDTLIDQIKLQIDLGMSTESQIHSMNAQRSLLEAGLKAAQNSIKSSMIALKRDLGIDIDRQVVLTSDLVQYEKFNDSNINELVAQAVENDYDKKRYEQDIELTEIEYKIASDYSTGTADQLQITVEDKKATLEALPVTKEVSLRTAYNSLKSLENSVEAAKLAVEADKINIEIMQKKIDAGVSSSIEIIELQNKLLNDQYTLLQNIISYMTSVSSFENSLEN
ncbi:TolC family protein [Desulfitobacterium hafniense]|uniref:TolC family protein n=1 Tax=Desulfitobacterium hafniense TaxID=49338 RepID=UPI00036995AF|nr:TolC family protein [Desulfitobacterium hafniense]